jgi:glycogen debranching enzyme
MIGSGSLAERALTVLAHNDAGRFFRPGPRVYPFQWNWDSALIALGLAHVDPARGRTEVRSLLRGQWDDGMVPHIVFHEPDAGYSPGPELWDSAACAGAPSVPTSGITQPPVLATAVRALHEADPDRGFLEEVVPALESWHRWLHSERVLDGSALVAILHPWESADNSPRFDAALARVGDGELPAVARTDRRHVDAAERPTELDYARYVLVVDRLRACGYRPSPEEAPFVYVDLCFNAVFAVAEADLAWLWGEMDGDGGRARQAASRLREALAACWDEDAGVYVDGDRTATGTVADLFPLYAGVPDARQARRLFDEALWSPRHFGPAPEAPWAVTSASKSSSAFDSRRYWRGPVWINVNWFLIRGLERAGLKAEAEELRRLTLRLVDRSGFSEYYEPSTGEPLGSDTFSWSAALTLDLLQRPA